MKNNFRFSLILFMLTIFIGSMYAQTVNGTVSSDDGPLPGATVLVKGSTTGVSTDFDGNFAIEAGPDDVLVVSFIGFSTQDVAVGDQDQIMVMLLTSRSCVNLSSGASRCGPLHRAFRSS